MQSLLLLKGRRVAARTNGRVAAALLSRFLSSLDPIIRVVPAVGRSIAAGAGGEENVALKWRERDWEARVWGLRQAVHRSGPDSIKGRDFVSNVGRPVDVGSHDSFT
jgi:hypothetical protein